MSERPTFIMLSFASDQKHEVMPTMLSRIRVEGADNSLRALVKYLDEVSDTDIVDLNIPTGIPLVYELDEELKPVNLYCRRLKFDARIAISSHHRSGISYTQQGMVHRGVNAASVAVLFPCLRLGSR
jgi:hypothetical protein